MHDFSIIVFSSKLLRIACFHCGSLFTCLLVMVNMAIFVALALQAAMRRETSTLKLLVSSGQRKDFAYPGKQRRRMRHNRWKPIHRHMRMQLVRVVRGS